MWVRPDPKNPSQAESFGWSQYRPTASGVKAKSLEDRFRPGSRAYSRARTPAVAGKAPNFAVKDEIVVSAEKRGDLGFARRDHLAEDDRPDGLEQPTGPLQDLELGPLDVNLDDGRSGQSIHQPVERHGHHRLFFACSAGLGRPEFGQMIGRRDRVARHSVRRETSAATAAGMT